jgi:hypothetical protein
MPQPERNYLAEALLLLIEHDPDIDESLDKADQLDVYWHKLLTPQEVEVLKKAAILLNKKEENWNKYFRGEDFSHV